MQPTDSLRALKFKIFEELGTESQLLVHDGKELSEIDEARPLKDFDAGGKGVRLKLEGVQRVAVSSKISCAKWLSSEAHIKLVAYGGGSKLSVSTVSMSDGTLKEKCHAVRKSTCTDLASLQNSVIVSAWGSGDVAFHQISSEKNELKDLSTAPRIHQGTITSLDVQLNTGSAPLIATAGEDGAIVLMDGATQHSRPLSTARGSTVCKVRFSSRDNSSLFTCGMGGRLNVWDVRGAQNKPQATTHDVHSSMITALAAHASRPYVATGSSSGILSVWDLRNLDIPTISMLVHQSSPVWDLVFLRDTLVTCGDEISLCDFNPARKQEEVIYRASNPVKTPMFSNNNMPINSLDRATHEKEDCLLAASDSSDLLILRIPKLQY